MTTYHYWKWSNNKSIDKIQKSNRNLKVDTGVDADTDAEKKVLPLTDIKPFHTEPSDKRSLCNERMSSRYMVIQTPINPFLNSGNYVEDLAVQDTMLRPKDSNVNKELYP